MRTHYFRLKHKNIIHILNNNKRLEIRVADEKRLVIIPGDIIIFNDIIQKKVNTIRQYHSFVEMLKMEDVDRISPGETAEDVLKELRRVYPAEKERLGVLVFELI